MQLSTKIVSLAILAISNFTLLIEASTVPARRSFDDYELAVATIKGTYNGNDFSLQGTIQDVAAQLETLYGPANITTSPAVNATDLASRSTSNKAGIDCIPVAGHAWGQCLTQDAVNNANFLIALGSYRVVALPRTCTLIACTVDSGVFECVDTPSQREDACAYLGSYVQDIINVCSPNGYPLTGGQEFDDVGYNIVVKQGCDVAV